jgi:hypothetical protein
VTPNNVKIIEVRVITSGMSRVSRVITVVCSGIYYEVGTFLRPDQPSNNLLTQKITLDLFILKIGAFARRSLETFPC